MKRLLKNIGLISLLVSLVWCGGVWADKENLQQKVVRVHIIMNPNCTTHEQERVIQNTIDNYFENISTQTDADTISDRLQVHSKQIISLINNVLQSMHSSAKATAILKKEPCEMREYDSFMLPSGVYESFKIIIDEKDEANMQRDASSVLYNAASQKELYNIVLTSDMSDNLVDTLTDHDNRTIRLLFLECLGRLENIFF